jgi:menaquinol-cytochrome c reductase iron-sulfur subunit
VKYELKRRNFLTGTIYTLSSLIAGTLGASVASYLIGEPRSVKHEGWSDAGEISELRRGIPQQVTFERSRTDAWKVQSERASAWVILDNHDAITAFSPQCTHLGCAYRWEAEKHMFLCPCHGSCFAKDGKVITGPALRPLDRYPVKVEGTRLWVRPDESREES